MNKMLFRNVKKVVVWGYTPDTHTHSYIHKSFYQAFKYLGYEAYWFNNKSDVSNFDFSNTLFLTSGSEESVGIPITSDGLYILHNCDHEKLLNIPVKNKIIIQVLTDPVLSRPGVEKINEYTYYGENVLYQPWATNLLPEEINYDDINIKRKNVVNYVGSVLNSGANDLREELLRFSEGCFRDNIAVCVYGGYSPQSCIGRIMRFSGFISDARHIELIKESLYAPQLNGPVQLEMGYIPCRIFKNISYGHYGVTNSAAVNRIFNDELIYDSDPRILYEKIKSGVSYKKRVELMKLVKEKHTYVNRIEQILKLL